MLYLYGSKLLYYPIYYTIQYILRFMNLNIFLIAKFSIYKELQAIIVTRGTFVYDIYNILNNFKFYISI